MRHHPIGGSVRSRVGSRITSGRTRPFHHGSSGTYLPVKEQKSWRSVTFEKAQRWYPGADVPAVPGDRPGDQRRRVHGPRRPVGLRQVHHPADARGSGGGERREDLHRRPRRHHDPAQGPRHRDGVPELRALPAHVGGREHGVLAQDGQGAGRRAQGARRRRRPRSSGSPTSSSASPRHSPAGSASVSPWVGRSCAPPRSSAWTSRCPTSTPRCACTPAPTSPGSSRTWASPPSTSPTTRSRR